MKGGNLNLRIMKILMIIYDDDFLEKHSNP